METFDIFLQNVVIQGFYHKVGIFYHEKERLVRSIDIMDTYFNLIPYGVLNINIYYV